jgi:hypothetical protein
MNKVLRLVTLLVIAGALTAAAAPAHATSFQNVVISNDITLGPAPDFFASGPFTATGPLCPSGQSADTLRYVLRSSATAQDLLLRKRFTCDDGSGSFDIALGVHLAFAPFSVNFIWAVVGGTGRYDGLRGFGRGTGVFQPTGILLDTYTGIVSID